MDLSYICPHCGAKTAFCVLPIAYATGIVVNEVREGWKGKPIGFSITGNVTNIDGGPFIRHQSDRFVTVCLSCDEHVYWENGKIAYPVPKGIAPARDMPKEALKEFLEAQSIIALSPRSACVLLRVCLEKLADYVAQTCEVPDYKPEAMLWEKIKLLGEKRGITNDIKEICDACRDTGNEFAHKGKYDLSESDTLELAEIMSDLTNSLVDLWVKPATKVARIRQLIPAKKR